MRKACAAVATLGVLTLAACNGEEPPPDTGPSPTITSETTETTEPSPTESNSEPAEPVEPTPPAVLEGKPSKKAAEAFVAYYWEVVNYAQATGNTTLLRSLQGERCGNCSGGAEWIESINAAGGSIIDADHKIRISSASQAPSGPHDWIVWGRVAASPGRVVGAGDLNQRIKKESYGVSFVVFWNADEWKVGSWDNMAVS